MPSTLEASRCTNHSGRLSATRCPIANDLTSVNSQRQDNIWMNLIVSVSLGVLQAPGDGEALCARLVSEGTADAVASEDMDTLPFGGGLLIRQLNAKRDRLELYSLEVCFWILGFFGKILMKVETMLF